MTTIEKTQLRKIGTKMILKLAMNLSVARSKKERKRTRSKFVVFVCERERNFTFDW